MPTYDYACSSCGHQFELFQSMTAAVKRTCPECKKKTLERLIGPGAGFLFKGDGFYITDYRSDGYKKDSKADKPGESKSDGGKEKKADPAPKKAKKASGKKASD